MARGAARGAATGAAIVAARGAPRGTVAAGVWPMARGAAMERRRRARMAVPAAAGTDGPTGRALLATRYPRASAT